MRDGRRKRLGLAEGTEGTVENTYLDRILEEAGPDTLTLDPNAFVNTRDQRYVNDAYNYYLGGGTGEVPTDTAEIPGAIDTLVDTSGEGQATSGLGLDDTTITGGTNLNDYDQGDMSLADVINNDANAGFATDPISTTPVDSTNPLANVAPDGTSFGNLNTGLEDYLDNTVNTSAPTDVGNPFGYGMGQGLANVAPDGTTMGSFDDAETNIDIDDTPVSTPSGNNPFGYEDPNPSLLANPAIANASGLDDIGADIGIDDTIDYGMPQGSPGQLNPAAPDVDVNTPSVDYSEFDDLETDPGAQTFQTVSEIEANDPNFKYRDQFMEDIRGLPQDIKDRFNEIKESPLGQGISNFKNYLMDKGGQQVGNNIIKIGNYTFDVAKSIKSGLISFVGSALTGIPGLGLLLNAKSASGAQQGLVSDAFVDSGGVLDDIGRIQRQEGLPYNTPENVMTGYSPGETGIRIGNITIGGGTAQESAAERINDIQETINNLPNTFSRLKESDPIAYQQKIQTLEDRQKALKGFINISAVDAAGGVQLSPFDYENTKAGTTLSGADYFGEDSLNDVVSLEDQLAEQAAAEQAQAAKIEAERRELQEINARAEREAADAQAAANAAAAQAAAIAAQNAAYYRSEGGGGGGGARSGGSSSGGTSSTNSGMGNLGFSDIRLKDNVELIGKSPSNINIYKFNYKGNPTIYQGAMAHEVSWASVKANNGYLMIDYDKIDVEFKQYAK